jgi:catechol 2,3-dioxygenase-like lactoylglutathione lyase family enzyme
MGVPAINGFGHIDLTVSDAERSARWWEEVLGFQLVNTEIREDIRQWAVMHPCGLAIIMVTHAQPSSDRFDERSVGLDHLALRVPDRAALEAWVKRFDELGVEHSGIKEENGGPLLTFRDPDNIQLEFHAFDPTQATTNIENEITLA